MKQFRKIKNILVAVFLFFSIPGFSQTDTSIVKFQNPSSVTPAKGYSHAAVIDLGNCKMIVLSGEVPFDKNGNLIGQGDIEKQTEQVFLNIKNILSELGGTMDNVIKLRIYMTDVSQIQTFRNVRDRFINLKNPPTSTLAQVSKLFRDDVLIEVEATAIIPE
jgi:enamine deaminase RidA (YjgF/YER057c/UK114 family)